MSASPVRLFRGAKARGERLAMISLYDAPGAALCCDAGVDVLLVGDSLGNVVLGYENTLAVTIGDMVHHTAAVARAGAHGVKLEGAGPGALAAVRALVEMGVPVMGHLGYTPQSSLRFESVVQGKTGAAAARLLEEAGRLEEAGCCAVVLEVVPAEVGGRVTGELSIPTIGIGAGPGCDGQVLVWHDLVGLTPGKPLRFVKRYADAHALLAGAAGDFVDEVRSGAFPEPQHGWSMNETELRAWSSESEVGEQS